MSASFKNNASFVSRLPTIRRHKSTSLHSPAPHSKPAHRYDVNASAENLGKLLSITVSTKLCYLHYLRKPNNCFNTNIDIKPTSLNFIDIKISRTYLYQTRYQKNLSNHFTDQATLNTYFFSY